MAGDRTGQVQRDLVPLATADKVRGVRTGANAKAAELDAKVEKVTADKKAAEKALAEAGSSRTRPNGKRRSQH